MWLLMCASENVPLGSTGVSSIVSCNVCREACVAVDVALDMLCFGGMVGVGWTALCKLAMILTRFLRLLHVLECALLTGDEWRPTRGGMQTQALEGRREQVLRAEEQA